MAQFFRQSTAGQEVILGPILDYSLSACAGITLSASLIQIYKAGAHSVTTGEPSVSASHLANGRYGCLFDASLTDTLGSGEIHVQIPGCVPYRKEFVVLAPTVYDAWFTSLSAAAGVNVAYIAGAAVNKATAQLGVSVVEISGSAIDVTQAQIGAAVVSHTTSAKNEIGDAVWDEPIAGHLGTGKAGAAQYVLHSGQVAAQTMTQVTLAASGRAATDDYYNNALIVFVSGGGAGQARTITDYGQDGTATFDTLYASLSSDTQYAIYPAGAIAGATAPTTDQIADAVWNEAAADHVALGSFGLAVGGSILEEDSAQSGTVSSIVLDGSTASATNDLYNYNVVRIVAGTGAGQSRQITDYDGSSKAATVAPNWTTAPASDSVYQIVALGIDAATVTNIAAGVWNSERATYTASGTFGEYVNADILRISTDATAANNMEAFFDGTGYAGTNNVIPTVTSVTNSVTANVATISGDSAAADALEALLDGTGTSLTFTTMTGTTLTTAIVGDVTGNLSGSVGSVTGAVGSVTGAVGSVTGNVGGSVATVTALGTQAKADVNAEVVDVIVTDARAEPAAVPAANAGLAAKVNWLFALARNKLTQNATTQTLRNDADDADLASSTVSSDGTTTTRGKFTT